MISVRGCRSGEPSLPSGSAATHLEDLMSGTSDPGLKEKEKDKEKDKDLDKVGAVRHPLRHHPLDAIFRPSSVAVIGATEKAGSVGRAILWNLISSPFGGTVFPVNPHQASVLGIRAHRSVADLPESPELAVIVTPAATVPDLIRECGLAGVKAAIVISAGFKEVGPEGAALEQQVLDEARRHDIRVVGPNCLGVMSPLTGLNASFASAMARPGSVGFISQSGALCTAVLDWSHREHVGFSAFVSIGSMADVGWGDLLDYLGHDPRTRSIVMYMESIGDARAFLSSAREIALVKPIIVLKVGRTQAAARAAVSHTGALTGSDEVLDAAFRRCGVLRVDTIAELFYLAEVLSKQPRPRGPRLTILTNAGGPGVLATDALMCHGGQLAELSDETMAALDALLPSHWSRNNPIDLLGDADPARYARAIEIAAKDPNTDGLLVVLTPQAATDPTQTAEQVKPFAKGTHKPLLASWMGGAEVAAGETILNRADVPTFSYPDTAARIFNLMWRYSSNLKALYETPILPAHLDDEGARRLEAEARLLAIRRSGRTLLSEIETKALLTAYDIPTVATRLATSTEQAVAAARSLGYPVVLKLHSETLTHKADLGAVRLNLATAEDVELAYRGIEASVRAAAGEGHFLGVTVQPMVSADGCELIVGSSLDPQFGPVLLFGLGGRLVDVVRDRSLALPPLNTTLARRLMERTKIYRVLQGARGRRPVDVDALAELLVRFSHLVADQRWVREIEINPLLASADRLVALDARATVHGPDVEDSKPPRLAIRPYPTRYVAPFTLRNGLPVVIRPIRPEDEPLMVRFHEGLSERSVYFRYFHLIKLGQRVSHERLTRICFIDYDRDMALVAEARDAEDRPRILGVGRLTRQRGLNAGEFAIIVSDELQGQGLGRELLTRIVQVGRDEGMERITADILPDNRDMQAVSEKVGFTCRYVAEEGVVKAELVL
jgi:acetyltransferase